MIGCNDHGHPPLTPGRKNEPMLDLPDFYLDLMFGEFLPAAQPAEAIAADKETVSSTSPDNAPRRGELIRAA